MIDNWMIVSTFIHIIDYQVCVQTVHDSHPMRSRNCTQIWSTLRSAISVAFEILVKKLQVKDTEAYQEMTRINYQTFWGISTAIFFILLFAISVWARFWQNCWPNHYHSLSSSRSNSKNYHVEFEHVQTTWFLMKCDDRARYHSLFSRCAW